MPPKALNLPWHQHDSYSIGVYAKGGNFTPNLTEALKLAGMQFVSAGAFTLRAPRQWEHTWQTIRTALESANALPMVEVSLAPGDGHGRAEHKTVAQIQAIADSLWLGDAIMEDRVLCYLQPIVSQKDKVFGYESFARVRLPDGKVIAGDAILAASRALGMEFMIDRLLQVQAITTFVSSDFNGFLFVNFLPGFIHRPSIYLEGLGETVRSHGVIAKHVVLEFTKSETPRDLTHLRSVCDYARSRGYSVALDDINTVEGARKLIGEVKPDFVKIDMGLAQRTEDSRSRDIIRAIADMTHAVGGTVIAEGVESAVNHQQLLPLGVDLFQGYHFSAPVPVEKAIKRGTGTR
ncbi:MAG: EAL domain-containing protein [Rickettsiales bacterium]|jgi:EAL domain-containing protein (putative c-di-GMP-specific phosphodiesterase class I)|nr:EAL domain-containing protein [Rickettsiales bacterium]